MTASTAALSAQKTSPLDRIEKKQVLEALAIATRSTLLCVQESTRKIEIVTSELTLGDLTGFRVIVPLENYLTKAPKRYSEEELLQFAEEVARAMNEALVTIGKGAIIPILRFKPSL